MDGYKERIRKLQQSSERKEPSAGIQQLGQIQNNKYIEYAKENTDEEDHGKWYRAKHLNDKYFKLEHITEIGLPFEVAMVLTKRGTGKTVAYMNLIKQLYKEGKEFVIVRNTKQEIEGGVLEQFFTPDCPFQVVRNKYVCLKENKDKVVGYLAYLSGVAQQGQGASYEKVHTIIWDEATNAGQTTIKTLTGIRAFGQLTSTFFRNKLDGRVGIFGNLMKDAQGVISDSLHRYLGIDTDCNFKYIVNQNEHNLSYRLLYINTANLYTGADDHLMSNISIDQQIREDLMSNSPSKMGDCIIGDHFFTKADRKEGGLLTTFDKQEGMILIASEPNINFDDPHMVSLGESKDLDQISDRFYIVRCEELKKGLIGFRLPIFSDDVNLANLHKDICIFKKDIAKFGYKLWKLLKSGRTLYVGDNSYRNLLRIMSGRKEIIKSYLEEKFPKKKPKSKSKQKK